MTLAVTDSNGVSATAPFAFIVEPGLILAAANAPPGSTFAVQGSGYQPGETVDIDLNSQPWGTAVANSSGIYDNRSLVVPATLPPGNYPVTAVGQSSAISASQTLAVSANWHFRYSRAGGSFNAWEHTIDVANVSTLIPFPATMKATGPINSSPAVYDGSVIVGSNDGRLYSWATSTGSIELDIEIGDAILSSPFVLQGMIYVGSNNGRLYGFLASCGPTRADGCQPALAVETGGAVESSPVGNGSTVYVGSNNGNLYAVNTSTGAIRWSDLLGSSVSSSPALFGNTVVVGSGDQLFAVNATNGDILWTGVTGGTVTSSPAVVGGKVFVGSEDGKLYAYPLDCSSTCQPDWSVNIGSPIQSSPAIAYGDVFVGANDGILSSYQISTHKLLWKADLGGSLQSSPAVANGVVYIGSTDDSIYALNAHGCGVAQCQPLWSAATGGPITSSPAVANGQLFIGSGDNDFYGYQLGTSTVPAAKR